MSKKQMGFTLIEIVMVLVLLGILSAVAVPKYFDLRAQAEQKAMEAVAAEVQAQINGTFATEILKTTVSCDDAVDTAMGIVKTNSDGSDASSVQITDNAYTLKWKAAASAGTRVLIITPKNNTNNAKEFTLGIPVCKTPTAASTGTTDDNKQN